MHVQFAVDIISETYLQQQQQQQLEVHSVERIYFRQRCFDASKPRVAAATRAQYGFSRRNKILRCSAYAMGESNPVPASELWSGSGSKVNQFVHVPIRVGHGSILLNPIQPNPLADWPNPIRSTMTMCIPTHIQSNPLYPAVAKTLSVAIHKMFSLSI